MILFPGCQADLYSVVYISGKPLMAGTSINLILKMSFFMGILQKRFIWSNLPGLLLRGRLVEFVVSKSHYTT